MTHRLKWLRHGLKGDSANTFCRKRIINPEYLSDDTPVTCIVCLLQPEREPYPRLP